jgi:hypothetical protein
MLNLTVLAGCGKDNTHTHNVRMACLHSRNKLSDAIGMGVATGLRLNASYDKLNAQLSGLGVTLTGGRATYQLRAVVHHLGSTLSSGHYVVHGRADNG